MIDNKKVLAVIPARGGSKGVPRKNIREVAGKPLIAWTIEEAKKSKYVDRLILSSDDSEIIQVAKQWGCDVPFIRPAELAQDDTPGIEPVLHALREIPNYHYIVLLQPTSPLRTAEDIDRCIEICVQNQGNVCVSVVKPDKSPYWMYTVNEANLLTPLLNSERVITRRQDMPEVYALNGAVYVANIPFLMDKKSFITEETFAYVMPRERSIDIDSELDLKIASMLLNHLSPEIHELNE
jgi:CMP-N,N'-diacetyllegionaminic acid synthase